MVDLHSHILPGLDHGAQNLAQSCAMLRAAAEQGVTTLVATPHVYRADFDRTAAQQKREQLAPYAQQLGVRLLLGYEFNLSALDVERPQAAEACCMENTRRLLVEFPFGAWPQEWKRRIYDLQAHGMELVIAHPERYAQIQQDLKILEWLSQMDCRFQVNAPGALWRVERRGRVIGRLMAMGRMDYVASDAHDERDYEGFRARTIKWKQYLQNSEQ